MNNNNKMDPTKQGPRVPVTGDLSHAREGKWDVVINPRTGEQMYYNKLTMQVSLEDPSKNVWKGRQKNASTIQEEVSTTNMQPWEALPLKQGWEIGYNESGRRYFINHINHSTQWKDPRQTIWEARHRTAVCPACGNVVALAQVTCAVCGTSMKAPASEDHALVEDANANNENTSVHHKNLLRATSDLGYADAALVEQEVEHFERKYLKKRAIVEKRVRKMESKASIASLVEAKDTGHSHFSLSNVREQFRAQDLNGNGKITKDELIRVLQNNGMVPVLAKQYAEDFFKSADHDRNGYLDANEFLVEFSRMAMFRTLQQLCTAEGFERYDQDKDGQISYDELVHALSDQVGDTSAEIEVNAVFDQIDGDQSGFLSYRELIAWYVRRYRMTRGRAEILLQDKRIRRRSWQASQGINLRNNFL